MSQQPNDLDRDALLERLDALSGRTVTVYVGEPRNPRPLAIIAGALGGIDMATAYGDPQPGVAQIRVGTAGALWLDLDRVTSAVRALPLNDLSIECGSVEIRISEGRHQPSETEEA